MAYTPTVYTNDASSPDLDATNLNKSENGIKDAHLMSVPVDCSSRVAEYTGDGIPLIPDNVAGRTYFQDEWATTDGWVGNAYNTVSAENGSLKVVYTEPPGQSMSVYKAVSGINGKLVVAKIRSTMPIINVRYYDGSSYIDLAIQRLTDNIVLAYGIINTSHDGFVISVNNENTLPATAWYETIYIGNGAYDTPALDRAGNGNSLSLTAVTPVDGKYGKEMSFNGSTSYAQASSPVIGTTGTISIRLKPASLSAALRPFGNRRVNLSGGVAAYIYAGTGVFEFSIVKADGSLQNVTAGSVSATEYKSFTFTWDGSTIKAYREGILINSVAQEEAATVAIDNLSIGRLGNYSSDYFNGIISHFRYDSRIWTADEVRAWSLNPSAEDSIGFSATPSAGKAMVWPENASGTFTPTIAFGGLSTGITYSRQVGRYVKIGDSVWVNIWITLTSKGTATGNASVGGLPFTTGSSYGSRGVSVVDTDYITFTTQGPVIALAGHGATTIDLWSPKTAAVMDRLTNANFANNSLLAFSMQYFV